MGMCDFRVSELKLVPDEIIERLATLLNLIEKTGRWPPCLLVGLITMIPKPGAGLKAADMRPISVMGVIYRVWSATRVRQILEWQELWVSPFLKGFRKHLGCIDAFWETALQVERALLLGDEEALCGLSLDF